MKILKLKIKNIASLAHEHQIDFENIQNISSIFAITGETGAGKSTILNCISLSLFGEVYKKNTNQIDLITLGEKDAEIQLIFKVKHQIYLADWKARIRKNDGELLKQPIIQRTIYQIATSEWNSSKISVINSAQDIIHMSYEQFCKCIILNQGEFARFLHSTFTERKEILEKLYPGEYLDRITETLKNEIEKLETINSNINSKITELNLSNINLDEINREIDHWEKKDTSFSAVDSKFNLILNELKSFNNYSEKKIEYQKKLDKTRQDQAIETEIYNQQKQKLQESELNLNQKKENYRLKLLPLQNALKIEEAIKIKNEELTILEKENSSKKIIQKNLTEEINQLSNTKDTLSEESKKDLHQFKLDINKLKSCSAFINDYLSVAQSIHHSEEIKKQNKGRENQIKIDLENLVKNIEQIQRELLTIPENVYQQIIILENKKKIALEENQKIKRAQELHAQMLKEKQLLTDEATQKKQILDHLKMKMKIIHSDMEIIQKEIKLHSLEASIQICLDYAKENQLSKCPVCSSAMNSEWELLEKKSQKSDLNNSQKRLSELSIEFSNYEKEIYLLTNQNQLRDQKLESISLEIQNTLPSVTKELIKIDQIEEELSSLTKRIWDKEQLNKELKSIKDKHFKENEQLQLITNNLNKIEKELIDQNNKVHQLSMQSNQFLGKEIDLHFCSILRNDFNILLSFEKKEFEIEKIIKEIQNKKGQQVQLNESISLNSNKITTLNTELERVLKDLSIITEGRPASLLIDELTKEVDIAQKNYLHQKDELNNTQNNLKELSARSQSITEQIKDYETSCLNSKNILILTSKDLTAQLQDSEFFIFQKMSQMSLSEDYGHELMKHLVEQTNIAFSTFKHIFEDIKKNLISFQHIKEDYLNKKNRLIELDLEKAEISKSLNRLLKLSQVLGKDELRSFVLSMVEKNLVSQTNFELTLLCQGRYQIMQQFKSGKLSPDFYIIDKFKNGERRKVSTLSGGETFMVSIAMALALAELTRGQTEISTLFIDEGFGTLDEDSLNDVVEMLNQIQSRGLLIGIISHVKSLTDSMPVNLHLTKRPDGTSSVGIIYH